MKKETGRFGYPTLQHISKPAQQPTARPKACKRAAISHPRHYDNNFQHFDFQLGKAPNFYPQNRIFGNFKNKMTREEAKAIIQSLVERFAEHRKEYHLPDYNEQKARQDFINPFFKALGWDIDNEKGASEAYREVIYEDKVFVRGKAKAPDYGFRLAGSGKKRLFFVEAKKPSVALKTNKESAYQLKRYGSSAQAYVSILTNFEDFIVYDCSRVPKLNDSASVSRLKHIHFEDYIKEFDFIYDTFSHDAVTKGRFDKFVASDTDKKGSQTLDKEFVQSLDNWRRYLATSIALNNRKLNDEEINFAVQQTIDRLIFLRFCEDRAVEPYGQLQKATSKGESYKNLFDLFKQADDKYNSGLFDFEKDQITPKLKVDNKVIKSVIEELYYPLCRYEFSVMPVEVLGNAYEQFLGKVIRITPARSVRIEEKPEVRKAGGVYYTPQYIVEYIVKNTVGKLVDGKTPTQIEKIKIVDPACGSGSFLLGAFDYLLQYHINWYHEKGYATRKGKDNPFTPQGTLTTHEKKRILLCNIFGVDLDSNAVEVTKLSLLLKCMEGETEASIKQQISLFHERVLPDLDNNIKSGNSLIDTDFYDSIDFGEEKKIKPFSWSGKKGFPEVFKQGGFDVVIGNPPYVSTKEISEEQKKYFIKKYYSATGQFDLYGLFIEKAYDLLSKNGEFGFITSSTFLNNKDFKNLREILLTKTSIGSIVNFGETVFDDANLDVTVLTFNKSENKNSKIKIILSSNDFLENKHHFVTQKQFCESDNFEFTLSIKEEDIKVLNKIFKDKTSLSEILDLPRGIELGSNSDKISERPIKGYEKLLVGKNIKKFKIEFNNYFIRFENDKSVFKELSIYKTPKILIQRIRNLSLKTRIVATIDYSGYLCTNTLRIGILKNKNNSLEFILGILNSSLVNYIFLKLFLNKDIYAYQLERIPIPTKSEKTISSEIEKNVSAILKLHTDLSEEKLPAKVEQIKQRIEHSEARINQLVYELYDLKEAEIKIIEEAQK